MEDLNKQRRIFLSLYELEQGPQEINSREILLQFTFQRIVINATEFEESANSP